jgi:redox-sensitive bicupin YhaK (pirin superfamily)
MHWVGDGFPVRSVFDYNGLGRELSPFLLLDYAAPHPFPPGSEKRGVGGHPHKGFETVTVVYQGELEHRDSSGGGGKIGAGDVQWMTAGNGIVHEEFHSADFARKGGTLQMAQLWVNLRAKDKSAKPRYQTLLKAQIPNVPLPQDAGAVRVISGEYGGKKGPAKTFTPINLWDVSLRAGHSAELPLPDGHATTFLVLSGEVVVNGGKLASEGDLVIFGRTGDGIRVKAGDGDAKLLVMDGEPIAEPVVGHGPFVMNSRAEIQQAFEDYQLGKMGEIA